MDISRVEEKKKMRKLAYGMVASEFKQTMCSVLGILCIFVFLCVLVLPYIVEKGYNPGTFYFFIMMILMKFYAFPEKVFYLLPLSKRQVIDYLNYRTNLIEGGIVVISVVAAMVLDITKGNIRVQSGLLSLIMMLYLVEMITNLNLLDFRAKDGSVKEKSLKRRAVIYCIYQFILAFYAMFCILLMPDLATEAGQRNAWILLLIAGVGFFPTGLMRWDVMRFIELREFRRINRRAMFGVNQETGEQSPAYKHYH